MTAPNTAAPGSGEQGQARAVPQWLERKHPWYERWVRLEKEQEAAFVSTREALGPFLVPHRFEQDEDKPKEPEDLDRAKLGFGVGLNASYLSEIFGHIRRTGKSYNWGPLAAGEEPRVQGRPGAGLAQALWDDATRSNVSWENFWQSRVLEKMCSTVGGFVVVDIPPGAADSMADEIRAGKRPYLRYIPMSRVEDLGRGAIGFRWIKTPEHVDRRGPKDQEDKGFDVERLIYSLRSVVTDVDLVTDDVLETEIHAFVERVDRFGDPIPVQVAGGGFVEEVDMGRLVDRQGQPTLPLVHVGIGEDRKVPWLPAGLTQVLAEIVVDIWNIWTEVREGFRSVCFDFLALKGLGEEDAKRVWKQLKGGSRMLDLGDDKDVELERMAADAQEVMTGLSLIDFAIRQWALSAKRKAQEATDGTTGGPRSGESIKQEFALDLVPLLTMVAGALDKAESDAMHLAAQLADKSLDGTREEIRDIGVIRQTDFRSEDESSRVTRLVGEFQEMVQNLSAEALADTAEHWHEAAGLFDMDRVVTQMVVGEDGETTEEEVTFREHIRQEAMRMAETTERSRELAATAFGAIPGATPPGSGGDGGDGGDGEA